MLAVRDEVWLRAVWESASDAMALSDPEGVVLATNPAYHALYGYRPEEVLGQSFAVIFPAAERAAAEAQYRQVFYDPAPHPVFETVVQQRNGAERIVESRVSFLEEEGRRVAMLSILRDVTEVVAARDLAARAERERRAFLSSVSHDLKNPLAAIKGYAQLLRREMARHRGAPEPGRLAAGLAQIEASALRLAKLVDELVDVTSLAAGDVPSLQLRPADLVALVRDAVARYDRLADYHQIVLEAPVEALPGCWDAARLERVLDNLLSNAIKYSPAGGTITVRVAPAPPPPEPAGTGGPPGSDGLASMQDAMCGAQITVEDHGIGIASVDLPHVFDRFHRGRNVAEHTQGSGIGLTSVKQIVEQHGGTIAVASKVGQGTAISIWLPVQPPVQPPTTAAQGHA